MKIKRIRKSRKARIEIIPMIDVMFFLLATFMLASLVMQNYSGVEVNLAHGEADKIQLQEKLVLSVDAQNRIFINQELVKSEELSKKLAKHLKNPEELVIIAADKKASQGSVIETILSAKKLGAHHFSMIIKEEK